MKSKLINNYPDLNVSIGHLIIGKIVKFFFDPAISKLK